MTDQSEEPPQPIQKYEFEWKIENLMVSTVQNRGVIRSPVFESKILHETSWYIYLVVDGRFDRDHIGVYVRRTQNKKGPSTMKIGFDVGILDVHGKERHTKSIICNNPKCPYEGLEKFVPRKAIYGDCSQLLVNDNLTLKGRIWKELSEAAEERILLRSTLSVVKVYEHIKASPQNQSRRFTIVPRDIQCEFQITFAWDCSDPTSSSELFFPTVTIRSMGRPYGWIFMSVKIWLKLKDHEDFVAEGSRYFDSQHGGDVWQLPAFKGPSTLNFIGCYPDNMDFMCEFTFSDSEEENVLDTVFTWPYNNSFRSSFPPYPNVLANDMKSILQHTLFPDVHLKVGDVLIPAHRFILSARSPVFRKILSEEPPRNRDLSFSTLRSLLKRFRRLREPDDNLDEIEMRMAVQNSGLTASRSGGELVIAFPSCTQSSTVRKMVSFLYTDDVEDVELDTAMKLLHASNKYQIDGLKRWCESFLKSSITLENACEMLVNINGVGCESLMQAVFLFMYENEEFIRNYLDTLPADNNQACLGLFHRLKEQYLS